MKYQLIGSNNFQGNITEEIFKNRNIDDFQTLLNVTKELEIDYNLLDNIDEAVECYIEHLDNNDYILYVIDPDTDGNTSGATLINYTKLIYPNAKILWVIHDKKQHGLSDIQVYSNVKLVVVPDAGSNDYEYHKKLKERGIDCIVLDHHMCEKYSEDAIVVNNQLSKNYPNKQLSGVGIVYKFIQALDNILWKDYSTQFLDLVALGNIADSMDTTSLETRYYIKQGLNEVNNPFILSLLDKQSFSTGGIVNITNYMFYIVPLINAMIRMGNCREKEDMFRAFLGSDEWVTYKSRGEEKTDTIANYSVRNCTNVKARQKRELDKFVVIVDKIIEDDKLQDNKLIIVDVTDMIKESGLTGLVATKIAEKYHKPTLIVYSGQNKDILNGSGRGYGEQFQLKTLIDDTKLVEFAEGHEFAFGISIKRKNIKKLQDKMNNILDKYVGEKIYKVDFILQPQDITYELIEKIYELKDEYGKGLEEPLLCIENIKLIKDNIQLLGAKKNTLKIKTDEMDYIKFFFNEDEYNKLIEKEDIDLTIIGKASINEYNGESTGQIVIEDYEIK